MKQKTEHCVIKTPAGNLRITEYTGRMHGISEVCFTEEDPVPARTELLKKAVIQLEEYFAGKRKDFDLPLYTEGTQYCTRVWQELKKIPYGETRSYAQIAEACGNSGAARAAGRAAGKNRLMILIPCHRVIHQDGRTGGYACGQKRKEYLLKLEAAHKGEEK